MFVTSTRGQKKKKKKEVTDHANLEGNGSQIGANALKKEPENPPELLNTGEQNGIHRMAVAKDVHAHAVALQGTTQFLFRPPCLSQSK